MMSSDTPAWLNQLIREVSDLLSEDALQQSCDEPVNAAASSFKRPESDRPTYEFFLDTIGSFISNVYAHGWNPRQVLSPDQAKAEAISLLQQYYQGQSAFGFEAAQLDALDPTFNGMEFVIAQITQILVTKTRKKHIRWILHTRLNSLDWSKRRLIAAELLRRWQTMAPDNMGRANSAQMADHCADLIMAQLSADAQVSDLISDNRFLHAN